MSGTPWEANRAVLARRSPDLLALLEAAARPPGLQCFDARSGLPALKAPDASGVMILLTSQYDPLAEAEALVDSVPTGGMLSYGVIGLGLGYHAEALLKRASPESMILVLEPDPGLARAALEIRDLSEFLACPRVHLLIGTDRTEIFERLEPHVVALFLGFRLVVHPPSQRRDPEGVKEVQKAVLDLISYGQTSLVTATTISYMTKQNLCMNLASYAFSPGLGGLAGAWKGRPAVVIAAGPSLGRNLGLLKSAKGRAALLAVGTALKPCLKAGVLPDLAATLDYSRLSAKYLEGMEAYPSVPLVVDPKGNWQAIESYPGPKYYIHNPFLDAALEKLAGRDHGCLDTGGTVAHLTYSLARHLGADPVIFVGLDLAYTHHTTHLPGTAIHEQWQPELNRFNTLEMKEWEQLARIRSRLKELPAQGGGSVFTDEQMFTYLQKFQKDWRKAPHRVIDATEGGASKTGAEAMPLAEALSRFATGSASPLPVPAPPDPEALRPSLLAALDRRLSECSVVQRICRDTLKRLKRIERRFEDRAYVTKQIAAIDTERKAMARYALMNEMIAELTQSDEFAKIRRDKAISAKRLQGVERLKAQLERDLDYVAGLKRGGEILAHMLSIARARTAAWPARIPWTDPQATGSEEEGVAIPGGTTR